MTRGEGIRQQSKQGEQSQQQRGSVSNGVVGPLALGFNAQIFADVAKGGFHLPAADEKSQYLFRGKVEITGQQDLWVEFTGDIADEAKTNVNTAQAKMEPEGVASGNVQFMKPMVIPGQANPLPERGRIIDELLGRGQPCAFFARTAFARIRWGWHIQGRIQRQAGNDRYTLLETGTRSQEIQRRIRAIGHDNQIP